MRFLRLGLLGYGTVGQAVARACVLGRHRLRTRGYDLAVTHALVRDTGRPRPAGGAQPALIGDPDGFFRHDYDVVVEALGGREPARTLVSRALAQGTPVVTVNKSLVAAHGEELQWLAVRSGRCLRFEACALAGVPFIGTLERRPLVSALTRVSGVLNGTSNYVLSAMARDHVPFGDALRRAQDLGLAEPDPSNDVRGIDAAEKLALLVAHFGARGIRPDALETAGIEGIEPDDLAQAGAFGGVIKPVAHAALDDESVSAFVGPALVPRQHPLAGVSGRLTGIALDGRFVDGLFFCGPGAGPDVTAATVLDDVVECAGHHGTPVNDAGVGARPVATCRAPVTPWFLRLTFPHGAPDPASLCERFAPHRVRLTRTVPAARNGTGETLRALTQPCAREQVERALEAVRRATGGETFAVRVLG